MTLGRPEHILHKYGRTTQLIPKRAPSGSADDTQKNMYNIALRCTSTARCLSRSLSLHFLLVSKLFNTARCEKRRVVWALGADNARQARPVWCEEAPQFKQITSPSAPHLKVFLFLTESTRPTPNAEKSCGPRCTSSAQPSKL